MWVGTFSGVTSAGMVISSARGGTCRGRGVRAAGGRGTGTESCSHARLLPPRGTPRPRATGSATSFPPGLRGAARSAHGHDRRAPSPLQPDPGPDPAAPRPPPGSPARRLPSPRSKMRTSRFMAATRIPAPAHPRPRPRPRPRPWPQPALSHSPALPALARTSGPRSLSHTNEPGGPERPGCAAAPPRGHTGHRRPRPAPGRAGSFAGSGRGFGGGCAQARTAGARSDQLTMPECNTHVYLNSMR